MARRKKPELDTSADLEIPEKYLKRYVDVGQCCKCGARSKITPIDNGTVCGVCGTTITVV